MTSSRRRRTALIVPDRQTERGGRATTCTRTKKTGPTCGGRPAIELTTSERPVPDPDVQRPVVPQPSVECAALVVDRVGRGEVGGVGGVGLAGEDAHALARLEVRLDLPVR